MAFKITKGIAAAGWMPGLGDTLRASGKALAILMLAPTIGKPLARIRVNKRTANLEIRVHTSSRCTRGSWLKLDSESTAGFKARDWAKLTKFWAYRVTEIERAGGIWNWADDLGKDRNRCETTANCNMTEPVSLQTLNENHAGMGRGRICKGRPNQLLEFGWVPASGKACLPHTEINDE